ncbi:hypothetical protein [Fibrella aestuarina]|uniref:hypothetical protein n=1 Tax=Fibrella aestuarina TaxID=651143 RepID=UPI00059C9767|nr:hypothetical protein [Fibrella aestuarina]
MKRFLYIIGLLVGSFSCKDKVEPEQEATIVAFAVSFTGCNDGWLMTTPQGAFTTFDLSESFTQFGDFNKLPRKVWMRYEVAETTNTPICKDTRIKILSIRDR